ncbi:type IV secretory pathway VirB10-like protein [Sphingomonas sp. BE270]|jgi:hypothetical protein|uniref:hypothetical protein n=1 Tax=unclassified Sphingomonas TaxID=196159 RepID=UPI001AE3CE13|nr:MULTISPECIES: hypothetical protein [unclassified Sphingomonas]MDR6849049.1 type IV secretory pathway VirB10-like protein [Sphingomonas sp. BE137]MDR7258017.1 type IV secretory pathway VirB10-like protein [Sphingomonas sp. BE270]
MKLMMFAALAAAVATPTLAQTAPAAPDAAMAQPAPTPPAPPPPPPAEPAPAPSAAAPAPAAPESYPWCSRTVTDGCREHSNAAGARLHSTPRPKR